MDDEIADNEVVLVWKVVDSTITVESDYMDYGIHPSGELMAVCSDYESALSVIDGLQDKSPSERFGEHVDPTENDMEDAPYRFTTSIREIKE